MSDKISNDLPSSTNWALKSVTLGDGTVIPILNMLGANGEITYVLPQAPLLVHGLSGEPIFSLSLILSTQPGPEKDNIYPLIERGILTMDVKIGVEEDVLNLISSSCQRECRRLFARKIEYKLLWSESNHLSPIVLAQAEASGSEGRAGISAHMNRIQTLDLLAALDGKATLLRLLATIHYQTAGIPYIVHLSGSWADIHDFLKGYLNESGRISETSLYQLIPAMSEKGLLIATDEGGNLIYLPTEDLGRLFMRQASVILRRESDSNSGENWFTLRPRPYKGFGLSYTESIVTTGMETQEICASIDQIIGGALEGRNWADYVHLLAKDSDNFVSYAPIPKKVRATRNCAERGDDNSIKMAAIDNSLISLSLVARPSVNLTACPNFNVSSHLPEGTIHKIQLDDLRLDIGKSESISLPIVRDRNEPYWDDSIDIRKIWYAPVFEIVEPEPNTDPSNSPFLFSFERFGATSIGEPALRGSVHFTLRSKMGLETESALKRDARISKAQPVYFENLSVSLLVPFVDVVDGQVKQHIFEAVVQNHGNNVIATVSMLNEWVGLTYGALSTEGFQKLPAQVLTFYTFKSYVPVENKNLELTFGGKTLYTPVVYSTIESSNLKNEAHLDATALTYVQPREEIHYKREAAGLVPHNTIDSKAMKLAKFEYITSWPHIATTTYVRPQLDIEPGVASIAKKVKYAIHTEVQQQKQALLISCNCFGKFYQEIRNGMPISIGCQDALKLGQVRYIQYEEIDALRDPAYQVYRSLQQPGHFLVVPAILCISRRAAGEISAYRPLIFLNARIDSSISTNSLVELRATLEPDLPLFKRSALMEQLKSYAQNPIIHYPTDISTEVVEFNWLISSSITANSETDILGVEGPFVRVYFEMDLLNWQLIRSVLDNPGISGSASFKLADGSKFSSNLLLKLNQICGPWQSGPLEIITQDSQIKLTNCVERTIDISDLVRYVGNSVAERVPVNISLAPGQTHTISASSGLQPVYSYPPSDPIDLKEVRVFIEDIYENVIFINLLNFSNYNLIQLNVEARLRGLDSVFRAQLIEEMPVIEIPIVLPLTTYLEKHVLDFRVIKVFKDRKEEMTDWIPWDLNFSVVISLERNILGL